MPLSAGKRFGSYDLLSALGAGGMVIGLSEPSFDAPFTPCVELGYRLAFEHRGPRLRHRRFPAAAVGNERSRRVMERPA
jgi:hypothetical protein